MVLQHSSVIKSLHWHVIIVADLEILIGGVSGLDICDILMWELVEVTQPTCKACSN